MTTNGESKFSHLLIGLGLGAIGGLIAAIFARKETREALREQSGKSLDFLNQQAGKLRETADVLVVAQRLVHEIRQQGDERQSRDDAIEKIHAKSWRMRALESLKYSAAIDLVQGASGTIHSSARGMGARGRT